MTENCVFVGVFVGVDVLVRVATRVKVEVMVGRPGSKVGVIVGVGAVGVREGVRVIVGVVGNYWGTTSAARINAKIIDNEENLATGSVKIIPFLTEAPFIAPGGG